MNRSIITLLAATALVACSSEPDPDPQPQPKTGFVRVVHLSPDAPAVDVFANQGATPAFSDVAFLKSTAYAEVDVGNYDFDIVPSGSDIGASVLTVNDVAIAEDGRYTAAAFGEVASIQAIALSDDLAGVAADQIRIRAIHAAAGVGQVDIWNIPDAGAPAILYENVDYGVAGEYLDLPAAAYTIGFDVDDDMTPDVVFEVPALAAGTVANVFAVADTSGVFLAAQTGDGTVVRIDAVPPEPDPARIRVIHLSPDAPAVDVFVNGGAAAAVEGLAFPDTTGYLELPPGTYTFDVAPAGAGIGSSVLTVADLPLSEGESYTAVAYDNVATLSALALTDDTAELGAGDIRIRAVHTAAGVGQVDIWNIPATGAPSILYENVDFGVVGAYLDLPAAAYTVGFDVDDDANPDLVFEIPALPAGTVANVFAVADTGGVFLAAQTSMGTDVARIDPTPDPRVRVLHLSPDAPAVDVYVNGDGSAPVVADLPFLAGTGFLDVAAGTYTFDVAPTGAGIGASVLTVADLPLARGESYTAVAYGAVASITALALVEDFSAPAAGDIRVRAVHAADGVGTVDIWNVPAMGAPSPLYTGVAYGDVGGYLDLPAGAYTLGFDVDADAVPDLSFEVPALPAGTVANIFAVNDAGTVFLVAHTDTGQVVRIDAI